MTYLEEYFMNNHFQTKKARDDYKREVSALLEYTEKDNLTDITRRDAQAYRDYMLTKYSKNTIYKKLRILNAVFNYFNDEYAITNPFKDISIPERELNITNFTEEDRIAVMLRKARGNSMRDLVFILLAYRLGLYASTIQSLKISDVKVTDGLEYAITLYSGTSKEVLVALPKDINPYFHQFFVTRVANHVGLDNLFITSTHKPYSDNYAWRQLRKYDKTITFTELRRLAATKMLASGVDIDNIQETLGIGPHWAFRYAEAVAYLNASPAEGTYSCEF